MPQGEGISISYWKIEIATGISWFIGKPRYYWAKQRKKRASRVVGKLFRRFSV
jgi:hypothetical protein